MSADWTGAIDCDMHPRVPNMRRAAGAHERVLERHRRGAGHRGLRHDRVSRQCAADGAAGLARGQAPARRACRGLRQGDARSARVRAGDLQLPVRGAGLPRREHGGRVRDGGQRLVAAEWLDKDPRLRASVVSRCRTRELAVEEIERLRRTIPLCAGAVARLAASAARQSRSTGRSTSGRKHGLTIGIHAGISYHHPVTGSGWPSYYLEDYAAQSLAFHTQLGSLICEGVFVKFPKLKVVLIESGVTWLAALPVAADQVLARRAQRGALDRPLAPGVRARPYAPDHSAV